MKFGDWLKQYKYRLILPKGSEFYMRDAYIAGQQDTVDQLNLPTITIPVKVAYVLCDNCEQYHEPEKACALTEGRS